MPLPFAKSWWVEPPLLLAGCYPGALDPDEALRKLRALLDVAIRRVISLQEPGETGADGQPFAPYEAVLQELARGRGIDLQCARFPIPDNSVPTPGQMAEILDAVDRARVERAPVYVHCWGGHGRTGMVVGCWLVRHGLSGEQALAKVRLLRQHDEHLRAYDAPQTHDQRRFVLDWERHESAAS